MLYVAYRTCLEGHKLFTDEFAALTTFVGLERKIVSLSLNHQMIDINLLKLAVELAVYCTLADSK